ncbi:BatD family protein [Vulcaniibacterium gelatinicum]|uniref:BatD family protein n=1 Tax=Vulcaniibacterium gelatinicum TaxID=2598725 RepID=UPI0011CC372A|nr:BatD family protein [Vulcaniibacterium gelatinicum]
MTRAVLRLLLVLGLCAAFVAQAQTRAWLDRERIAFGETATLNVETDQPTARPDFAPLLRDFEVGAQSTRRSVEIVNGVTRVRVLFGVALRPRREGVLGIPPLRVGTVTTEPLALTVLPDTAPAGRAGDTVFVETEVDDLAPYVQQAVGVAVRLHAAVPLLSGQLEQPAPEGATLQRVGQDLQYSRELGGRRYDVIERRYLLFPERSGELRLPGARFSGQGAGGFFDDLFGDARRALAANAAPATLQVRPIPADAPLPWLPLHALRLRWSTLPQRARAGEAATVVVEAVADGATAAQLPELQVRAGDAQVLAEPVQADMRFVDGRPQATLTRRFAIVPARAGTLRIEGPRIGWWNVRADRAETAGLPTLELQVLPGAGVPPPQPSPVSGGGRADAVPPVPELPWALIAAGFAVLWFVTLLWALRERTPAPARGDEAVLSTTMPTPSPAALRHALEAGDLGAIEAALCALAAPPVAGLDALQARLADPAQRAAVQALQRARWGGGDPAAARRALREAFRHGPHWQPAPRREAPLLPPLYPPA